MDVRERVHDILDAILVVPPEWKREEGFHDGADFRGNVADGGGWQWPEQEARCVQVVQRQICGHAVHFFEHAVFILDGFHAVDGQRELSIR